MTTILVPASEAKSYTLYAYGKVLRKTKFIPNSGVYFQFEGTVVMSFVYKMGYKKYRKIICIRDNCNNQEPFIFVPNVQGKTHVLARFEGRGVDRIKNALFLLEKNYGKKIYTMSELFWNELFSLIGKKNTIQISRNGKIYHRKEYANSKWKNISTLYKKHQIIGKMNA